MAIVFDENKQQFYIHTKNTTYAMEIYNGILAHLFWGNRTENIPLLNDVFPCRTGNFTTADLIGSVISSSEKLPSEYPTYGSADLREPAFHAQYNDGSTVSQFRYKQHRIFDGKPALDGLPATYSDEDSVESLEIEITDELTGISVFLLYSAFYEKDVITRSVRVVNNGECSVDIKRVLSCSLDFFDSNFEMIHLHGGWAKERHIERVPVIHGLQSVDSKRGASSHHHNPFIALLRPDTTEEYGDVYGFCLMYSGNFIAGTEVGLIGNTRVFMGINPFDFSWQLDCGCSFQAPEVIMVYSPNGIGGMSRLYHRIIRENVCRSKFRNVQRPILVNNWEATYFNFNEDKILDIATNAKELGIELMVMDDGWFGKRNDSHSSLGDWYVNSEKIPSGISGIAEKITNMGMKFGLWFEPEMISPDSDLYRMHPDWCIHVPNRKRNECRWQLILDLSRDDVCDYIVDCLTKILKDAKISYIKWDMNRNMSEIGSAKLSPERQRELPHRYILGLYRILEKITNDFPDILFESCSGGGGRFDAGMLYYMPQIWTSDDTDAVERLYIQEGTSIVYPTCTMGAHVSAVPNHQVGRNVPMEMRGFVAMMGQFGYELDIAKLSEEEKELAKWQIDFYKKHHQIIHKGDMYRLASVYKNDYAAYQFVSPEKDKTIVMFFTVKGKPDSTPILLKLAGLENDQKYKDISNDIIYGGDMLMNIGLPNNVSADFNNNVVILEKI